LFWFFDFLFLNLSVRQKVQQQQPKRHSHLMEED
jgi:hypothetical protein